MPDAASADPVPEIPQRPPVVVKKYANRRLYNTESSSYITLDNLAGMIRVGRDFVVYDAKSGEDITRGVLTQIIVEEESKGRAMLPTAFLRQIIGFYGDSLQQFVPSYLEQAMSSFALQQQQMRSAMQQTVGNFFPVNMQEVGRQNMQMMERAMSLFAPFYRPPDKPGEASTQENQTPGSVVPGSVIPGSAVTGGGAEVAPALAIPDQSVRIQQLQDEVAQLRQQLAVPVAETPGQVQQLHAEIQELRSKLTALPAPEPLREPLQHEVESPRLQLAATRVATVEGQAGPNPKRPVRKPETVKPPGALQ